VIELKTAELFRASCFLGAYVGGHGDAFAKAADDFGLHIGTAYQIFDDVADLLGEESAIGKTLGTDLASGKYTLPVLLLLEGLDAKARTDLEKKLAAMKPAEIASLLAGRDVVGRVRRAFDDEVDAALKAIAPYRELPAHGPLSALADYVRNLMVRF
jgi:octaprenyl-diphosphate synthase